MRYRILGPLQLEQGRLAQGHQRLLLAVLLLRANETVSADTLVEALWNDPPATALRGLRNLVCELRKVLGDALVTEGHGYRLRVAAGELDAERFERVVEHGCEALARGEAEAAAAQLRSALALWRGPALADLAGEPVVRADAARLDERRLAALEARIEADLALGRHADVVPELAALVAAHPLRERLRAQQMLALYRAGRQAEALGAYADARHRLVEELGIEPGPALRRVEQAVLEHDPALGAPADLPRTLEARRRRGAAAVVTAAALGGIAVAAVRQFQGRAARRAQ